jgi:hypothetical protein
LGYQGGKAARKDQKLLLLRSFRDKLVCGNQEWYNNVTTWNQGRTFETLTTKEKDGTQFDSAEAYNQIITVLEKEFENDGCLNLLTWERTPPPPSKDAIFCEKIVMISTDSYKSGQTTIYDFLDENAARVGRFGGEPSKYLVFSYANNKLSEKDTKFDLEQPQSLSMEKYFPSTTTNTSYRLIGLLSHCGENVLSGHNLAYRLINKKWYYFNDKDVREKGEDMIGKAYGWEVDDCETSYLAFFEHVSEKC